MKKLVTVIWATTQEVEVPDDFSIENAETEYFANVIQIIHEASNNINWKGGEITSVDEIYDDVAPPNFDHDARFDEGGEFYQESS